MEITKDQLLDLYRTMATIRAFEERATQLFGENKIWGTIHSYAGEEAIAAGLCAHLRDDDWITSTHRGHGHCIAKRADLGRMFAELLGKETGYCRGRGGSMHIADTSKGNLGANGIVGGGIPIATGAALTAKQLGTDQVAVSFFGDGASNQGIFHEAANLASVLAAPVIYVCENNMYNEYTHYLETTAGTILGRAAAFGIEGAVADGQDVRAVNEVATRLVNRARSGGGPAFLQCDTYRYSGHHVGDINGEYYRSKQEEQTWRTEREHITVHGKWLVDKGHAGLAELEKIASEARAEMEAAVKFAIESPYPSVDEVDQDVYA